MNGESDAIVKLIFFVFQTLLSIFLGIIDLGRFRDNFRGVFLGFLSGMKGFKKISRNAWLSGKTILLKIVKVIAKRGSARDDPWKVVIAMIVGGLSY